MRRKKQKQPALTRDDVRIHNGQIMTMPTQVVDLDGQKFRMAVVDPARLCGLCCASLAGRRRSPTPSSIITARPAASITSRCSN